MTKPTYARAREARLILTRNCLSEQSEEPDFESELLAKQIKIQPLIVLKITQGIKISR